MNSHPHTNGRVALVHNGIIENYSQLMEFLEAKGYEFESQTDTETIVKLLDFNYDGNPTEAIARTLPMLKGSYALGILFKDYPDKIFAVRKDSPLIAAIGEHEMLIASDVPAILKYTRKYCLLEEGEIAILTKDNLEVRRIGGALVNKQVLMADWDLESAQKGGYPHLMLKEIHEEPQALKRSITPRLESGKLNLGLKEEVQAKLKECNRLYIVACGTAMNAGLVGKSLIENLARLQVDVCIQVF